MSETDDSRVSGEIQTIDFHGDEIVTFLHEGEPFVAMRRVVDNLGVAWQVQHRKLTESGSRFGCNHMVTHDASGRRQEMLAMPVNKLALWLATINPNKVPDPIKRAKVELYQAESAIALHDYWTKGLAINQAKLSKDDDAREAAINELRRLRSSDRAIYRKITDSIKATSYDYQWELENRPQMVRSVFAWIKDTFHVAVCGKTSQALVLENADGNKPLVGMISFDGDPDRITERDVRTGMNYLQRNAFLRLQNLYDQLFLFVEQHMLRGEPMSLTGWEERLSALLRANGYESFKLYSGYHAPAADRAAKRELAKFKARKKLKP